MMARHDLSWEDAVTLGASKLPRRCACEDEDDARYDLHSELS